MAVWDMKIGVAVWVWWANHRGQVAWIDDNENNERKGRMKEELGGRKRKQMEGKKGVEGSVIHVIYADADGARWVYGGGADRVHRRPPCLIFDPQPSASQKLRLRFGFSSGPRGCSWRDGTSTTSVRSCRNRQLAPNWHVPYRSYEEKYESKALIE
jgi:hypothetical protein